MPEELEWKTRKDRGGRKLTSLPPAWTIVQYRPSLDTASLLCHTVGEYATPSGTADCDLFAKGRSQGTGSTLKAISQKRRSEKYKSTAHIWARISFS